MTKLDNPVYNEASSKINLYNQSKSKFSINSDLSKLFERIEMFKQQAGDIETEFQKINNEIQELAQKQEYIEKKWYTDICSKIDHWHQIVLDERVGHDLMRNEIIEEMS